MAVRLVRCTCNHMLRYGAAQCGYCFRPTSIRNRVGFLAAVVAAGAVATLLIV